MARKTPVLLRKAPISNAINVLTRYSRRTTNGKDLITAALDGKHDVTSDFWHIALDELCRDDVELQPLLVKAARGRRLTAAERQRVGDLADRLGDAIRLIQGGRA